MFLQRSCASPCISLAFWVFFLFLLKVQRRDLVTRCLQPLGHIIVISVMGHNHCVPLLCSVVSAGGIGDFREGFYPECCKTVENILRVNTPTWNIVSSLPMCVQEQTEFGRSTRKCWFILRLNTEYLRRRQKIGFSHNNQSELLLGVTFPSRRNASTSLHFRY